MPQPRFLPLAAFLTCVLTSHGAASVTINDGQIGASVYRALGNAVQSANLPGTADATALASFTDSFLSSATRAIDDDGISISLEQLRGGGYRDYAYGYAYAYFTPDVDTPYSVSGSFANSAGNGSFYLELYQGSQLYFGQQTSLYGAFSQQIGDPNEGTFSGSPTGLLRAGSQYLFVVTAVSQAWPSADDGASTAGTFRLQFGDPDVEIVPEPASIAVWSCLSLGAIGMTWVRKRRVSSTRR
jgi:hypothetical protein